MEEKYELLKNKYDNYTVKNYTKQVCNIEYISQIGDKLNNISNEFISIDEFNNLYEIILKSNILDILQDENIDEDLFFEEVINLKKITEIEELISIYKKNNYNNKYKYGCNVVEKYHNEKKIKENSLDDEHIIFNTLLKYEINDEYLCHNLQGKIKIIALKKLNEDYFDSPYGMNRNDEFFDDYYEKDTKRRTYLN